MILMFEIILESEWLWLTLKWKVFLNKKVYNPFKYERSKHEFGIRYKNTLNVLLLSVTGFRFWQQKPWSRHPVEHRTQHFKSCRRSGPFEPGLRHPIPPRPVQPPLQLHSRADSAVGFPAIPSKLRRFQRISERRIAIQPTSGGDHELAGLPNRDGFRDQHDSLVLGREEVFHDFDSIHRNDDSHWLRRRHS